MTVITPALAAGATDVTVNNANGTSTLSGAYLVNSPPVASALNPTSGSPLGGETVTISGSNFTASDTVTFAGVAAAVTFVGSNTLSVTTPALAPGATDVTVTNANGSSTLTAAYLVNNPPVATAINPTSGSPLGGETVTISGSNFTASDNVTFAGIAVAVTFVDSNTLSVVTPPLAAGAADVTVSNVNGSSTLSGAFLVNGAPTLASITPTSGSPLGGDSVTLTGSGFTPADSVTFGGITGAVTFVSSTTLTVVTPALPSGAVDVTVSNVNGSATLVAAFLVNDPPLLASINPVSGSPLGGESVTLNGSGFTASDSVTFGGIAAAVTFVDANTLSVITPVLAAGAVDVTVVNANGSSTLAAAFLVNDPPLLASINPTSGSPLGGETVTLTGSGFTGAESVTIGGIATAVTFVDMNTLTVITPALPAGAADVTISNVNGSATLAGAFLVNGAPTLTTVTPNSGSPLGGESVTLTGSGFTPADSVTFGGIAAAVTFVSSNTLTAITPALTPGAVDVTVSNSNGSDTLTAAFVVNNPPLLSSVAPTSGSPLGGDSVTLNGSDFVGSESVTFGGIAAAVTFVDANTLSVITPALASGATDVTVSNANGSSTLVAAFLVNDPPLLASINPTSGSPLGGENVTLNGSGFTAADNVTFGGIAAVVTFVDANTLTVLTPALTSGATDVTVTNSNGSTTLSAAYFVNSAPVATAINPTSGSPLGGETVTLSGSNFTAADSVTFAGIASVVTFVDSNTLSLVTPALPAGAADVTVSNVNGSSTLSGAFLVNGAPTLSSISPTSGSPLGGDNITLSGSGFTPADTVTFAGLAAAVTFVNSTTLTVITPALAPGVVDVTLSNTNGSSTLPAAFTVNNPPSLVSIAPTEASPLGGEVVTLTGADFDASTAVTFGGVAAAGVTFVNTTTLNAVTPALPAGTQDVTVSNSNGSATLAAALLVNNAPVLLTITPNSGSPLGGETITLGGTDFTAGTTVTFGATPAASVIFVDANNLSVVTPPLPAGGNDVTITNINGSSTIVGGFTAVAAPTLAMIAPSSGSTSGGDNVTLTGSGFTLSTAVTFGGVSAATVNFVDSTTLTVTTPALPAATVDVTVTNANGSSTLIGAFTANDAPLLSSVSPAAGTTAGGDTVTLSGSAFTADATVTFGAVSAAVTFVDSNTLSVVTSASSAATVDVTVTNSFGSSTLPGSFTYVGAPDLISLTPVSGPITGGTLVTLTGTGFDAATTVDFGAFPAATTFVSATTLEVNAPAQAQGQVAVTVTNANGSDTLNNAYEYLPAGPTITNLGPITGPAAGGTTVSIVGSGFTPGTTVTFDGVAATVSIFGGTLLDAVTPAHAPGVVDVVVSNANGSATASAAFTYEGAILSISAVAPTQGSDLGGDVITVTGTGFTADATVSFDGTNAATVFVDDTTLQATTPPHAAAIVDVTVTSIAGSVTLTSGFVYLDSSAGPLVTQVTPNQGEIFGGETVEITGSGFTTLGDVAVTFGANPATVTGVTPTSIFVASPSAASVGFVDVTVTTSGGSDTLTNAFEYVQTLVVFTRGDSNGDGILNVADGIFLLVYLFQQPSATPNCFDATDINDDGGVDISDTILLINYLFNGGPQPAVPFDRCGVDPTPGDSLSCVSFPPCE